MGLSQRCATDLTTRYHCTTCGQSNRIQSLIPFGSFFKSPFGEGLILFSFIGYSAYGRRTGL